MCFKVVIISCFVVRLNGLFWSTRFFKKLILIWLLSSPINLQFSIWWYYLFQFRFCNIFTSRTVYIPHIIFTFIILSWLLLRKCNRPCSVPMDITVATSNASSIYLLRRGLTMALRCFITRWNGDLSCLFKGLFELLKVFVLDFSLIIERLALCVRWRGWWFVFVVKSRGLLFIALALRLTLRLQLLLIIQSIYKFFEW